MVVIRVCEDRFCSLLVCFVGVFGIVACLDWLGSGGVSDFFGASCWTVGFVAVLVE